MAAVGTRFANRYVLGPVLGWGGSARVHQARDEHLDRDVALKLVHVDDDQALARLQREASVAARVMHEHVIQVFDAGTDPQPFVVMQLVRGRSLSEVVREKGPLPPGALTDLARGLLAGSAAIHAAEIVHRDISPANVLIADTGAVKITDFGLARGDQDPTITDAGTVLGTVAYVAPERRRGADATVASDLYEIGATLYFAGTGQAPALEGRLPDGLPVRALLEHLLAAEPDDRPASAEEALATLEARRSRPSTKVLTQARDAVATTRVIDPVEAESDWKDRVGAFWSEDAQPMLRDAQERLGEQADRVREHLADPDTGRGRRMALLAVIALVAIMLVLAMPSGDPAAPPTYDPGRPPAENAGELADWLREVTGG